MSSRGIRTFNILAECGIRLLSIFFCRGSLCILFLMFFHSLLVPFLSSLFVGLCARPRGCQRKYRCPIIFKFEINNNFFFWSSCVPNVA